MLELTTLQKSIIKRNFRTIESLEKKVDKIDEKIENQRIKFEEKVAKYRADKVELEAHISSFEMPVIEMTGGFTSSQIVEEETAVPMYVKIDGEWVFRELLEVREENREELANELEQEEEALLRGEAALKEYEEEADKEIETLEETPTEEVEEDPFENFKL